MAARVGPNQVTAINPWSEAAARDNGLLVNAVKADVIRLVPPLIVTEEEIDAAVAALSGALATVSESAP